MNRSKNIGTAAETAVVRYARASGFPLAERRALAGSLDLGDILLCPGVILECKAWKQYSDADVLAWLEETERERLNANADKATLVVKRRGKGDAQVGTWWAIHKHRRTGAPVYMHLSDALRAYRAEGYGDEVTP